MPETKRDEVKVRMFLLQRILGTALAAGLAACSPGFTTVSSEAPVRCSIQGESSGPQEASIINGFTLSPRSRIARASVFLMSKPHWTSLEETEVQVCTGILIGPRLILTAAHCVETMSGLSPAERAEDTYAVFSVDPLCATGRSPERIREENLVSEIFVHPQYDPAQVGSPHDLALIRLKADAPAPMVPIPVSFDPSPLPDGEPVYVAGYGRQSDYSEEGRVSDQRLRFTTLYPSNGAVADPRLTAHPEGDLLILDSDRGSAACSGDSGGPAMVLRDGKLIVVGVASFVFNQDEPQSLTCQSRIAYTRPAPYKSWILSHLSPVPGPSEPSVD